MNVRMMVLQYLEKNGYTGLYDETGECGCDLDDIMPCEDSCGNCKPGHKVLNTENSNLFGWSIIPASESSTDSADFTSSVIERASKK